MRQLKERDREGRANFHGRGREWWEVAWSKLILVGLVACSWYQKIQWMMAYRHDKKFSATLPLVPRMTRSKDHLIFPGLIGRKPSVWTPRHLVLIHFHYHNVLVTLGTIGTRNHGNSTRTHWWQVSKSMVTGRNKWRNWFSNVTILDFLEDCNNWTNQWQKKRLCVEFLFPPLVLLIQTCSTILPRGRPHRRWCRYLTEVSRRPVMYHCCGYRRNMFRSVHRHQQLSWWEWPAF